MDLHKIIGYILLFGGLLLIAVPLWQTYNIFVGKSLPPSIFMQHSLVAPNQNLSDNQQQDQKALTDALPMDLIINTLNLVSWFILMMLLMFGGKQLADIGIKLIKVENNS